MTPASPTTEFAAEIRVAVRHKSTPIGGWRVMNCIETCPKGLNPGKAIGLIKDAIARRGLP